MESQRGNFFNPFTEVLLPTEMGGKLEKKNSSCIVHCVMGWLPEDD